MIDLLWISGVVYAAYVIVKSILNNDTAWATYHPKHKKINRMVRFLEEES